MLKKEDVVWGYKILLNREPESDSVINEKLASCKTNSDLVSNIMDSIEFKNRFDISTKDSNDSWVITEHPLGFRMWVNLADKVISGNIIKNNYEPLEVSFVKKNVKDGDLAIDIGANIGFYSLLFSKCVGPSGHVIGFEPLPFLHEAAIRSVNENGYNQCRIHNVALGAESGEAQLLYAPESPNWGGAYLSFDGIKKENQSLVSVPIRPLSDFVGDERINFIKIDVEGAESIVLGSSRQVLKEHKPIIMSEIHKFQLKLVSNTTAREYISMIRELGYGCYPLLSGGKLANDITDLGETELANVAFIPN